VQQATVEVIVKKTATLGIMATTVIKNAIAISRRASDVILRMEIVFVILVTKGSIVQRFA